MSDTVTSFKVAFLSRCAEEGLTIDQIHQRVKTAVARAEAEFGAEEKNASALGLLGSAGKGIAKILGLGAAGAAGMGMYNGVAAAAPRIGTGLTTWYGGAEPSTAAAAALLGPTVQESKLTWPALGATLGALGGGGYLVGSALGSAKDDPMAEDELKNRELINEYKRLADRTRAAAKRRQLLEGKGGF